MCSAIDSHQYGTLAPLLLDAFSTIKRSSSRLKHLTDQVLSFSQLSENVFPDKLDDINCYDAINFLVLPYTQNPEFNDLEFYISCDHDINFTTNLILFNQVLINLLQNAVKFTHQGEVSLHVNLLSNDRGIAISLCDTGIGISINNQENIFKIFEQGFDYENRQYEGVGIGLSLVKKGVELLNGTVLLESEVNVGSCFSILLPITPSVLIDELSDAWSELKLNHLKTEVSSKQRVPQDYDSDSMTDILSINEDESGAKSPADLVEHNLSAVLTTKEQVAKILVVDDDKTNRFVLKAHLNEHYDIVNAEDGEQCLEILKSQQIDLVLLDLMMPVVSGFDVLETLNADKEHHYPPIIVMSGLLDIKTKSRTFLLGAVDYVTKPFNSFELIARVKMHLALSKKELDLEFEVLQRTLELQQSNNLLEKNNKRLEETFQQLLHVEKMASIGQLAAGVAHEINNPIGYIQSNINTLKDYVQTFLDLLSHYQQLEASYKQSGNDLSLVDKINSIKESQGLDFIIEDIETLLTDTTEGTKRVRNIVTGLTGFARVDSDEMTLANVNEALESTIKLVWNELKYKTEVNKTFAKLPDVLCNVSQLSQVFTNILVNAVQSIKEFGQINITTSVSNSDILITIADTGSGIDQEHVAKLFDPFFTTKPVGQGTGLGLYLSYEIIKKHHGRIDAKSELGKGTEFTISLPIKTDLLE